MIQQNLAANYVCIYTQTHTMLQFQELLSPMKSVIFDPQSRDKGGRGKERKWNGGAQSGLGTWEGVQWLEEVPGDEVADR